MIKYWQRTCYSHGWQQSLSERYKASYFSNWGLCMVLNDFTFGRGLHSTAEREGYVSSVRFPNNNNDFPK